MSEILTDAERSQRDGARAERSFELWRSWAQEHTLQDIEEQLRAEEVTRTPLPLAVVRGRWVVVGGLLLTGLAALYLVTVFIAVHGA